MLIPLLPPMSPFHDMALIPMKRPQQDATVSYCVCSHPFHPHTWHDLAWPNVLIPEKSLAVWNALLYTSKDLVWVLKGLTLWKTLDSNLNVITTFEDLSWLLQFRFNLPESWLATAVSLQPARILAGYCSFASTCQNLGWLLQFHFNLPESWLAISGCCSFSIT